MGYKVPVYEDRRTVVMSSGNKLELHEVQSFDCSGSFLRLEAFEGNVLINEKNIDWMIVKNDENDEVAFETFDVPVDPNPDPFEGYEMTDEEAAFASFLDDLIDPAVDTEETVFIFPVEDNEDWVPDQSPVPEEIPEEPTAVSRIEILKNRMMNPDLSPEEVLQLSQAAMNMAMLEGMDD